MHAFGRIIRLQLKLIAGHDLWPQRQQVNTIERKTYNDSDGHNQRLWSHLRVSVSAGHGGQTLELI